MLKIIPHVIYTIDLDYILGERDELRKDVLYNLQDTETGKIYHLLASKEVLDALLSRSGLS